MSAGPDNMGIPTQGRLTAVDCFSQFQLVDEGSKTVAIVPDGLSAADARRLAACWNACEGMSTENLESLPGYAKAIDGYHAATAELDAARALLAEVVTADDEAMKTRGSTIDDTAADKGLIERIRALIDGKPQPEATARTLLAEINASIPADHYDPLVDRIRALLGPAGGPLALASVGDMAQRLVDYAGAVGVAVTVDETVVSVQPARGRG